VDPDQSDANNVLSAFDVKSSTIGMDVRSWRKTAAATREVAGARARLPRFRIPPAALAAVLAVALVAVLAFFALGKYNIYDKDVKAAQALVAQGQYAAAIGRYQKAIDEWPRNQRTNIFKAWQQQRTQAGQQADALASASPTPTSGQ